MSTIPKRNHPLAKGTPQAEDAPRDPRKSHSAAILFGALAIGALSYVGSRYLNSAISPLFAPPASQGVSPVTNEIVNLGYASYRGLLNDSVPDVISWLGVPYAKPPRRFRAAHPLDESPRAHQITDLFEHPQFCIQSWAPGPGGLIDRGGAGSEDCLFINIHSPRFATNTSSLPVLVYIHGGGYYNGNPRNWPFDNWVQRSPTPFVAVSIYYRLSALGFLAAPDTPGKNIYAGEDPELLLNAGFYDQRLALRFIQRHIRSFGGDPTKVTIMGQSAGAGSVGLHLVAQGKKPDEKLFHRAILQSWYRTPFILPVDRKPAWDHLTKLVGCSHSSWNPSRTLQCLKEIDHVKIVQAADEGMSKNLKCTDWMWQPLIDKKLFDDFPNRLLSLAPPDVDIMVGHTTHDSVISRPPFSRWASATFPKLSSKEILMLEDLYTKAGFLPDKIADAGLSEGMFRCSSQFIANIYGSRAFTYRFDEPDPINPERADHCADNYILFEGTRTGSNGTTTFHPLTQAQRALADEIISYFIAFAATGNPNDVRPSPEAQAALTNASAASGHISPTWPAHNSGKRLVFRAVGGGTGLSKGIKGGSYVEELDKAELERCKVWDSLADIMQI